MEVLDNLLRLDRPDLNFLFIACEKDKFTPAEEMRDLASRLKSEKKRLVQLTGPRISEPPSSDYEKYAQGDLVSDGVSGSGGELRGGSSSDPAPRPNIHPYLGACPVPPTTTEAGVGRIQQGRDTSGGKNDRQGKRGRRGRDRGCGDANPPRPLLVLLLRDYKGPSLEFELWDGTAMQSDPRTTPQAKVIVKSPDVLRSICMMGQSSFYRCRRDTSVTNSTCRDRWRRSSRCWTTSPAGVGVGSNRIRLFGQVRRLKVGHIPVPRLYNPNSIYASTRSLPSDQVSFHSIVRSLVQAGVARSLLAVHLRILPARSRIPGTGPNP